MNKKLLTIAIALVILAMVVAPVAAQLPAKSPLPSGKPYELIWTFLQDLQNQIKGIPAGPQGIQGPPGPAGAQGPAGKDGAAGATAHFGTWTDLPVSQSDGEYTATAATDGFVTCTCGGYFTNTYVTGFDSSTPIVSSAASGTLPPGGATITMPVYKGENFKIEWSSPNICQTFYLKWMPSSA
jgi:hypothetical protein